jgi:hypothetical protein
MRLIESVEVGFGRDRCSERKTCQYAVFWRYFQTKSGVFRCCFGHFPPVTAARYTVGERPSTKQFTLAAWRGVT